MIDKYIYSGSLPENASTYVTRDADQELYNALKAGQFCYVLNSRQTGKSSLRVRTMSQLSKVGFVCVAIDLSFDEVQNITPEQWYVGFIETFIESFELDVDFDQWWYERELFSPLKRFRKFIEEILLMEIRDNIIIFIDEIDSVLSLKFPTDDFFAFIRACYNQRVDNSEYNRLTFCLLGVASPSDLIQDTQRTSFNIGRAVTLKGFQLHEVEPLINGLQHKYVNSKAVMKEILKWTGGQPFITQKLCDLLVNSTSLIQNNEAEFVEKIVKQRIIDNWESQDIPEHLRTIKNRIIDNELVSSLLGIYQNILLKGEVEADESHEQIALRLSGLVKKQQEKLIVYNRIYEDVFNKSWIEKQLAKLRPYNEAFTAWLNSSCQDESRLLRGQALQEAINWSTGKSLSNLDSEFLIASRKYDTEVQEEETRILTEANKTLTEAQVKAKRLVRIGSIVLAISLLGAMSAVIVAGFAIIERGKYQKQTEVARLELAGFHLMRQFGLVKLESLLNAMQVGQEVQDLVVNDKRPDEHLLQDYLAGSPLQALDMILDNINQRNQLQTPEKLLSVSYSPDRKHLATGGNDGTIRIWNILGKQLTSWSSGHGQVLGLNFSPNKQHLATVGKDGIIRLWDLSGKQLFSWRTYQGAIRGVSFSPNGQYLTTGGQDGTVKTWNLSGEKQAEWKAHKAGRIVHYTNVPEGVSVSFHPNGKQLATAGPDHKSIFWDLSGKQQKKIYTIEKGEVFGINFSPDGQRFATAQGGERLVIRDLSGNKKDEYIASQNGWVWDASFSPDGKRLAAVGLDGITRIWDLSSKPSKKRISWAAYEDGARVSQVRFSPDKRHLVTLRFENKNFSKDGKLRIWDLSLAGNSFIREFKEIASFDFDSQGQHLVLGKNDGTVQLWNLSNKQLLVKLSAHRNQVTSVNISSNAQYLVTAGKDRMVRVWNLSGKKRPEKLMEWRGGSIAILSPDDQHVAIINPSGIDDILGNIEIWNISGNKLKEWTAHIGPTRSIDFSPNGKLIATAGDDAMAPARLWDLSGEEQARIIPPGQNRIEQVSFSPDGQLLATAGVDATARLWNLSGQQVSQFEVYPFRSGPWIRSVSFSPDGKFLVTTDDPHGKISLWNIRGLKNLLNDGCDWLKEYLASHSEWRKRLKVCQRSQKGSKQ